MMIYFRHQTATGEQKLNEAATIAVHIEHVYFPLKVSLLEYLSKATLNDSKRTVWKYQRSIRSQWLWAVCTMFLLPYHLQAPYGLHLNYDPWSSQVITPRTCASLLDLCVPLVLYGNSRTGHRSLSTPGPSTQGTEDWWKLLAVSCLSSGFFCKSTAQPFFGFLFFFFCSV